MIGIVAALRREVGSLIKEIEGAPDCKVSEVSSLPVYEGSINGREVTIIISGVGRKGSERATRILIDSFNPDLIVTTGYAGSLTPDLVVGDVVVSTKAVSESGNRVDFIKPDLPIVSDPGKFGTILTVDRFIGSVTEKRDFGERLGASMVDMESLYIGRIANEKGVACLGVRVISDDLKNEVPKMYGVLNDEGEVIFLRALSFFVRYPGDLVSALIFFNDIRRTARILNRYIREKLFFIKSS
jgi:nucleoside phosphorylase